MSLCPFIHSVQLFLAYSTMRLVMRSIVLEIVQNEGSATTFAESAAAPTVRRNSSTKSFGPGTNSAQAQQLPFHQFQLHNKVQPQ